MSEQRATYRTATDASNLLQPDINRAMLEPEVRASLEDVRRKAIALVMSIETVLGCEPSIATRAQRRAR